MKLSLALAAALLAVPGAALACSCMYTEDPAELRSLAKEVVPNAIALVEAETILTFEESKGVGDRLRIVRSLAGSAEGEFRVERRGFPSSASCDDLHEKGHRAVLILYPAQQPAAGETKYRISGLCTAGLLQQPVFRDEVARLLASKSIAERG
jgi:hypothetical protein